ncbi:MAG TPA: ABC transporter permease [Pyrinomonadaceae bacterium]|nr:ABC transporter permease [Pyrinomonadaceae bacterium]
MIAKTLHDIRYAFRKLRKNPGFASVVVLTLALGIGANAAIFSLTDKVLLQSLPVAGPEQLAVISAYDIETGPERDFSFSYPMYQDLRDRNDVFQGVIARGGVQMNVSYGEENERVRADVVSGNYFQVLGVNAWTGRLFTQDDDRIPGGHPVAVISYRFWERRFGKDPAIAGKTILANEHPVTVIGVTPPGFFGVYLSSSPDVWVPMMMTPVFHPVPPTRLSSRRHQWLSMMARRKDGVSNEQAQSSLGVLYRQIRESEAQQLPPSVSTFDREQFLARKIAVLPGAQGFQTLQSEMRTSLLLLFGATCVVLLILAGNLTNLMMARATGRAQETAVRLALGASRLRLVRQWLTEGLVLSLLGGMVGIVLAIWLKAGLMLFIPPAVRSNLDSPISWRFIGFTLLVSIVVGVAFSLIPAVQSVRNASAPSTQMESRNFTSAGRLVSLRSGLIVAQVALSVPLLISAALLLRTLQNLRSLDIGFGRENLLLATLNPSLSGYTPEKSQNFYDDLLQRTLALPGVASASLASDSPISGGWDQNGIVVEGYTPHEDEKMSCDVTYISPDYFRALGIPLVLGRDFNDDDTIGSAKVTIINEKMARYFFGADNPIGRRIGLDKTPDITIVGVVRDAQYVTLRQEIRRHFYTPIKQEKQLSNLTVHAKTTSNPESVAGLLRAEVRALDPHLPLYNVKTLSTEIDESLVQERLVTWLSTAFGLLATLLAAVGLYGVLTFSVARRTREIGIRVALGAQRSDVFKMIISHGMILVGVGLALGVAAAIASSRLIEALLFGIAPTHHLTFVAASGVLLIIAMLACYLPARRATKVDPLVALRYE